ncbi:MAG: Eco57I restriction-modification methylase domain-containing protein [Candidatus Hodarchaeota archaeon]
MNSQELDEFIEKSIKIRKKIPEFSEFFYFILLVKHFIPNLGSKVLNSKNDLINYIIDPNSAKGNYWQLNWLKKLFSLELIKNLTEYLHNDDTWWNCVKNVPIGIYIISDIYESFEELEIRKKTGSFFTPKSQIQVLCHYALFYYFKNIKELKIQDEIIFNIVFKKIYPKNLPTEIYSQINFFLQKLKVVDPSCGSGTFLIEMIDIILELIFNNPLNVPISKDERKRVTESLFSNFFGFDINKNSIKIAKIFLMKKFFSYCNSQDPNASIDFFNCLNIFQQDFLTYEHSKNEGFDIFIGNPPFVRHHDLSKIKIEDIFLQNFVSFFPDIDLKLDLKADLYIYFWIKAMAITSPQGVVAFVTSRAWLSSRYTLPIFQIFKHYFNLDLILEFPFEVWTNVEVRTHILIGHKEETKADNKEIKFLIWKKSFEKLLMHKELLLNDFKKEIVILNTDGTEIKIRAFESNLHRINQISNSIPFFSNEKGLFPILRLDYLEMSPFILMDILLKNKNKFCLLKDLGRLEMGSTTGANWFFYLDKKNVKKWDIPLKFLHPMTKSPKDWNTICTINKDKMKYLFHIPERPINQKFPQVLKYLDSHQDLLLTRPYFKNRTKDNWFRIPLIKPELLIPNMIYKRSFVAKNQDLHIDKQWIGFWSNNSNWNLIILAFLNSTLGILLREIQGTKTLGLGSLKLSLREVENLLVLDPRKFPDDLVNDVKALIKQLDKVKVENVIPSTFINASNRKNYYTVRTKIDRLILKDYMNFKEDTLKRINQVLEFEFKWRFAKEFGEI